MPEGVAHFKGKNSRSTKRGGGRDQKREEKGSRKGKDLYAMVTPAQFSRIGGNKVEVLEAPDSLSKGYIN